MLPYGHQIVDEDDIMAVVNVLRSDWLTTGPTIANFENAFASFVGAKHAIAVSSGTAALHAAAFAAELGPDGEMIVPALTFVASANCARYAGARIVFADVRGDTLTVDPAEVARLAGPKTRAIMAVDYAGQPADLDELRAIAQSRGIRLIEDAAHSIGATYRNRRVGTIADITVFSLHPVKQMTSGEGGVVVTNDDEIASRVRRFRNHGISSDARHRERTGSWFYEMTDLGFNYRLTDLQAALGLSQLRKLPAWLLRRRAIVERYDAAFRGRASLELTSMLPDRVGAYHLYPVRLKLAHFSVDRATVFRALRAENIGVNVHYIPVPWHPYYQALGYTKGNWPVAEDAYERLLTLPLWAGMTDRDVDDVVAAVDKVTNAFAASV
jgi:UDP-4-amino-4,6-dideoxy-N-acetyl-beta-L-altrosamine transaminase